jgi:hypothetical protein
VSFNVKCIVFYIKYCIVFVDCFRWEETHLHFAKDIYDRTPKRTDTLDRDLFRAFVYTMKLMYICEQVRRVCRKFLCEILMHFVYYF